MTGHDPVFLFFALFWNYMEHFGILVYYSLVLSIIKYSYTIHIHNTERANMNSYIELKNTIQKEINQFPIGFAFSKEQFEQTKRNWNISDNDELVSIGGGFIRKTDRDAFTVLLSRSNAAIAEAIAADQDGTGFIKDMFLAELANHEYCYTGDLTETLEAVNMTAEQVKADPALLNGLKLALQSYATDPEAVI